MSESGAVTVDDSEEGEEIDPPEAVPGEATVEEVADEVEEQPANESGDVEEATVDLSDEDLGGDLFDGVEDDDGDSEQDSSDGEGDGSETQDDEEPIADGLEGNAAALEETLNEGMAQVGVFGLTEEDFEESNLDKDGLRDEFQAVFESFRFGYFGSQVIEEYVLNPADGEVSPAWGLAGAMLMASATILWMRPDGDEKIDAIRDTVTNIAGGVA